MIVIQTELHDKVVISQPGQRERAVRDMEFMVRVERDDDEVSVFLRWQNAAWWAQVQPGAAWAVGVQPMGRNHLYVSIMAPDDASVSVEQVA